MYVRIQVYKPCSELEIVVYTQHQGACSVVPLVSSPVVCACIVCGTACWLCGVVETYVCWVVRVCPISRITVYFDKCCCQCVLSLYGWCEVGSWQVLLLSVCLVSLRLMWGWELTSVVVASVSCLSTVDVRLGVWVVIMPSALPQTSPTKFTSL